MKKVAIIGCGFIGQKRAKTLKDCQLVACVDHDWAKANALASAHPNCQTFTDWQEALQKVDIEVVIIATLHHTLAEISLAAVKRGIHVLVEKPAGISAQALEPVILASAQTGALVRVGFNHRYHRAFRKAYTLMEAGELGELMFLRARYGHGGRVGYDKEWRSQPALSGGGELIDQGVHLIDLARSFLGNFNSVSGYAHTYYWDMPVDDNAFLLLKTKTHQVAHLHVSCTEWKNTFSFEVYGKKAKLAITGLGGSYGTEQLSFYQMSSLMGPPETTIWEYPMVDNSWQVEFDEFLTDIKLNRQPAANLMDAKATLQVVEEIYRISKS